MTNRIYPYQSLVTKWLFHLTLLWSVFLFSGYVDSQYLTLPTKTTTELVEAKKSTSPAFVFQKSNPRLAILIPFLLFVNAAKASNIAYNQLQQVKLLALIKKSCNYILSFFLLPTKTIPADSKEAVFSLFIG